MVVRVPDEILLDVLAFDPVWDMSTIRRTQAYATLDEARQAASA
jgi:hypothetical protein